MSEKDIKEKGSKVGGGKGESPRPPPPGNHESVTDSGQTCIYNQATR